MKKKKFNIISVFLIIILTFTFLSGCVGKQTSDSELIQARIDSFLDAYNSGNMDTVLECMDSKTKNTYKSAMNLTNALIGKTGFKIDLSDIFSLSVGLISDDDLLTFDDIDIKIISDDSAEVYGTLSYQDKSKINNSSEKVCFIMKKESSDWFIQDIKSN